MEKLTQKVSIADNGGAFYDKETATNLADAMGGQVCAISNSSWPHLSQSQKFIVVVPGREPVKDRQWWQRNYHELALRTESPFCDVNDRRLIRILHAAVGLCTEVGELIEANLNPVFDIVNLKEEIGDMCWYLALGSDAAKTGATVIDLEGLSRSCYSSEQRSWLDVCNPGYVSAIATVSQGRRTIMLNYMAITAGRIQDIVKRAVFYSKPLNEQQLWLELCFVYALCMALAQDSNLKMMDIQEANIAKLQARYPKKFEAALSEIRNLAAERAVLVETGTGTKALIHAMGDRGAAWCGVNAGHITNNYGIVDCDACLKAIADLGMTQPSIKGEFTGGV